MMTKDWRDNLHSYLGGIMREMKGVPVAIGGIEDHVHLLVGLRAVHRLDFVLRDLKAGSSLWADSMGKLSFQWQGGYAAVSVSPSQIERVTQYICNQERHHQRQSFQEEYVEMLRLSGIEYEERYLW